MGKPVWNPTTCMHVEVQNTNLIQATKRYVIDLLNSLCFANTISWDSTDQYNMLPIFSSSEEESQEQRGAFLVNLHKPHALRLLVTTQISSLHQVCYRLVDIKKPVQINNPSKVCFPLDGADVDFSISDLNLGTRELSSYSFSNNTTVDHLVSKEKLFSLVRFLLDSAFVILEDSELFKDLLTDTVSLPPISGDAHYIPIYGVVTNA